MNNLGALAGLASNVNQQAVASQYHGYVQAYLAQGKSTEEAQALARQHVPGYGRKDPLDRILDFFGWVFKAFLVVLLGAIIWGVIGPQALIITAVVVPAALATKRRKSGRK